MKEKVLRRLPLLFFLIFGSFYSWSQSISGMNIYGGVSAMYNNDSAISPEGTGQYGYLVGIDGRLLSGDLYFMMGARYHQTSIVPESKKTFLSNEENYTLMDGRFGLGFTVIKISPKIRLRSKILLTLTYALNSPEVSIGVSGYERLNDAWGGAATGIGLDYRVLTLDIEYHYGLGYVYYEKPSTKVNGYSLTAGFFF